jgi:hypothetical protein
LLLTLPLQEKRLLLFLHLPGGSFVDPLTTKIQDVSTQYFFFFMLFQL